MIRAIIAADSFPERDVPVSQCSEEATRIDGTGGHGLRSPASRLQAPGPDITWRLSRQLTATRD